VRYEVDFEDETWLRRMRGGRVRDWLGGEAAWGGWGGVWGRVAGSQ
ncbi:MAG: hypothetical protein PVTTEEND_001998, partial [Candidatus Fervidibacter sp.]